MDSPSVLGVLLALPCLGAPCIDPPQAARDDSLAERLERAARSAFEARALHGLSVVVAVGDEPILARGWGYADPESESPADVESRYRAGAISAPLAAIALVDLLGESEHTLDTPVGDVLAGLSEWDAPVTIRHVLAHTSSLPDWGSGMDGAAAARDPRAALAWLAARTPEAAPGTCFGFTPADLLLTGLLAEELAGEPLPRLLRRRFFEPLGMEATFHDEGGPGRHELSPAVQEVSGEACDYGASIQPFDAGSLCTSARDLFAFTRALAGLELVEQGVLEALTESQRLRDGEPTGFGLGLGRTRLGEHEGTTFGGALSGAAVHVAWYPSFDLTVVALANGEDAGLSELARTLARVVLELPEPGVLDLELEAEAAAAYLGTYSLGCDYYAVRFDGRHIVCEPPHEPAFRLLHQGRDVFVVASDSEVRVTFEREREGGRAMAFLLERLGVQAYARRIE